MNCTTGAVGAARARHVLIVVENLPVPFDRRVWSEATALRAAGYEVTVICPGATGTKAEEEVLDGVTIRRHPLREATGGVIGYVREYAQALFWETRLAWRTWRSKRFDAIHLCNPPDLLFLVATPFKWLGAKVVFDHHDLNPELYVTKFGRTDIAYQALCIAERLTFATADLVISTNASYARVARERGKKRAEDVVVVRSAPDMSRFERVPPRREPSDADALVVGYVGVMAEQDGVHLLLHALHRVVESGRFAGLQALLVGDGPSRAALEALADDLGLQDVVRFTGFLTGDDLLEAMSRFHVGVCPDPKNPYNDKCTMNKILEYMALGIPVVQFDLEEGRRSAEGASLYAGTGNDPSELADRIADVLDDPALRARLGDEGRTRMTQALEWRHQVPKLLEAYATVLR